MASNYDATEFIDTDFQQRQSLYSAAAAGIHPPQRAPTREEVDAKVVDAQQKLVELKRAQEQLERERAGLEETRRRQTELQTGRQEMVQTLTRGVGLLQEAEFNARRDADQMATTLAAFRDSLDKLEAIHEQTWTKDNFTVELARALTTVENARMEWNAARLKLPLLAGSQGSAQDIPQQRDAGEARLWTQASFGQICRFGLALNWPVALVLLAGWALLFALLLRH